VNDRDNKSQSALQYALKSHNVVAAMTLLKAGASVEGKDDEGRTVLHLAAKYGNGSFFSC
jgi:ankyrin repeat protein